MTARNELKELYLTNHRQRYPDFPEYARYPPKYTDRTANGLTKMIKDYIELKGGQAERVSVTGRKISQKKTFVDTIGNKRTIGSDRWIKSNMTKGSADISATINGLSVKIEVKIGTDRQSKEQKEYQKHIEQAKNYYLIAKSFEDFLNHYKSMFN